jgi:hypothetical protein
MIRISIGRGYRGDQDHGIVSPEEHLRSTLLVISVLPRYDPTPVNQSTTAGGDDGVDMTLLLITNSVEAVWLLLLAAAKFADLADEKS